MVRGRGQRLDGGPWRRMPVPRALPSVVVGNAGSKSPGAKKKKKKKKRPQKAGPGFAAAGFGLALGLFFFVGGLIYLRGEIVFTAHAVKTDATVVGYHTLRPRKGSQCITLGPEYAPIVAFTDTHGRRATASLENRQICTKPVKGSKLQISYDPANPSKAQLPSIGDDWVAPVISIIFGGFFTLIGVALAVATVRARRVVAHGGRAGATPRERPMSERKRQRELARRQARDRRLRERVNQLLEQAQRQAEGQDPPVAGD